MQSKSVSIVNFYKFVELPHPSLLRDNWKREVLQLGLLGTILLAPEGVNGALAGPADALVTFLEFLKSDPLFTSLSPKWSEAPSPPFKRLEVKVKRWIIRFAEEGDPEVQKINTAPRMSPAEVLRNLEDRPDDFIVVDTRNDYETECGMFAGAVRLPIKNFTEFPETFLKTFADAKDKTFLFYCTGGVRCEKVVPWAVDQGFTGATQLDGGILKYFEEFGTKQYDGHCFVFDDRVQLDGQRNIVAPT